MRQTIDLYDSHGFPMPLIDRLLGIYAYFPDSHRDRRQLASLVLDELQYFHRFGSENFAQSTLAIQAEKLIKQRTPRMLSTGLVALCLIWMYQNEHSPSLRKAAKMAAEIAVADDRIFVADQKERDFMLIGQKLGGHPENLEKIFRAYRKGAHIAAASISQNLVFGFVGIGEETPNQIQQFLSNVGAAEHILRKMPGAEEWEMWRIEEHLNDITRTWPPDSGPPELEAAICAAANAIGLDRR